MMSHGHEGEYEPTAETIILGEFNTKLAQNIREIFEGSSYSNNDAFVDFSQEDYLALAVELSLPDDADERHAILDEFQKRPDGRFTDYMLVALSAYNLEDRRKKIIRALGREWRPRIKYAQHLRPSTIETLDRLEQLLGGIRSSEFGSNYLDISNFLENAEEQMLIDRRQHQALRSDIAPNL